jgi:hypothetical protein
MVIPTQVYITPNNLRPSVASNKELQKGIEKVMNGGRNTAHFGERFEANAHTGRHFPVLDSLVPVESRGFHS